jgi:uncharacterized membrane protein SirB2
MLYGRSVLVLMALLTVFPAVSAHGGEAEVSEGVSSGQALVIAALGAAGLWQFTKTVMPAKSTTFTSGMVGLTTFTGLVHVLLGLEDTLLLVGGLGVLAVCMVLIFVGVDQQRERQLLWALAGVVAIMFIGYFVANHDPGMMLEDRLGIATKLAEVALLGLLYRNGRATKV